MHLLLSCEHATNAVPERYRHLFDGARATAALRGHRGCDLGALELAESLQAALGATLFAAEASRLLIDLNRSLHHRELFSEFSRVLNASERAQVIATIYSPYRMTVERHIERQLQRGATVVHISVHSFAPRLRGHTRNADIGLLYDSKRPPELQMSLALARALLHAEKPKGRFFRTRHLRVRRNYPYRGAADGLTTALRRRSPDGRYLGIEIEVNQRLLSARARAVRIADRLAAALQRVLDDAESV